MKGQIVGIDLGTTFSSVGVVNGTGKPIVVPNNQGEMTTPSVVWFKENQKTEVGEHAYRSAMSNPDRVIQEVKRNMGTDWRATIDDQEHSPEEISAFILKKIKSFVEKKHDTQLKTALITVPAYFKEAERKATKKAGEIAGFEEEILIEEPIAGFLSEYLEKDVKDGLYFVLDLGGGTQDSTILEVDGDDIDVVSIEGEDRLGGQDFTRRIMEWLEDRFGEFEDPRIKQDVFTEAERAKKDLSNSEKVTMNLNLKGEVESIDLTRQKFEELIDDLVEKVIESSHKAVDEAASGWEEIEEVLLIGGSSRIPKIQEEIERESGIEPRLSSKPDLAVTLGATIKAAFEKGIPLYDNRGQVLEPAYVNEILSHSLGIETVNLETDEKMNSIILKKGQKIPAEGKETFTTEFDNQTNIRVL
ncbi:MAG: Hsp70 family protein, partial [Candidatus Paceibacterota bacterium]